MEEKEKGFGRARRITGVAMLLLTALAILLLVIPSYNAGVFLGELFGWGFIALSVLSLLAMIVDNRNHRFNIASLVAFLAFMLITMLSPRNTEPTTKNSVAVLVSGVILFAVLPFTCLFDFFGIKSHESDLKRMAERQLRQEREEALHRQEIDKLMQMHQLTKSQAEDLIRLLDIPVSDLPAEVDDLVRQVLIRYIKSSA